MPFAAPPGIRWVRIDRASGKPVFGAFPTTDNDPKAEVIWEAFQPQTEAIHSQRSTFGDPYSAQYLSLWQQAATAQQQQQQQAAATAAGPGTSAAGFCAGCDGTETAERLANSEHALVALILERF